MPREEGPAATIENDFINPRLHELSTQDAFYALYNNKPSLTHIYHQVIEDNLSNEIIFFAIKQFLARSKVNSAAYDSLHHFYDHMRDNTIRESYLSSHDGDGTATDEFMEAIQYSLRGDRYIVENFGPVNSEEFWKHKQRLSIHSYQLPLVGLMKESVSRNLTDTLISSENHGSNRYPSAS